MFLYIFQVDHELNILTKERIIDLGKKNENMKQK